MNDVLLPEESTQLSEAEKIKIVCQEDYEKSGAFLKGVRELKKKVNSIFEPIVKKAHEAHKKAKEQQNAYLEPIERCEKAIISEIKRWEAHLEEKRKEEEHKREEERQKLIQQAKADELWGDDESAKELKEKAAEIVPVVQSERIVGLGIRKSWKFTIIDESQIPREWLTPDTVKIGQYVRSQKELTNIPGIKVFEE